MKPLKICENVTACVVSTVIAVIGLVVLLLPVGLIPFVGWLIGAANFWQWFALIAGYCFLLGWAHAIYGIAVVSCTAYFAVAILESVERFFYKVEKPSNAKNHRQTDQYSYFGRKQHLKE